MGNRLAGSCPHAISDRDQADRLAVHRHEHRRFPLRLQRGQFLLFSRLQLNMVLCQQFRSTDEHSIAINLCLYASSRNRLELAIGQQRQLAIFCSLHNGACQGVLGVGFRRCRHLEQPCLVQSRQFACGESNDIGHSRFALGQRSSLIENDGLHV